MFEQIRTDITGGVAFFGVPLSGGRMGIAAQGRSDSRLTDAVTQTRHNRDCFEDPDRPLLDQARRAQFELGPDELQAPTATTKPPGSANTSSSQHRALLPNHSSKVRSTSSGTNSARTHRPYRRCRGGASRRAANDAVCLSGWRQRIHRFYGR